MAIKIRKSIKLKCNGCNKGPILKTMQKQFYDIGIGEGEGLQILTLCDDCMHTLLRKLIITGADEK